MALQYNKHKVVAAVESDGTDDDPDDFSLDLLDTDSQEKETNAEFEDSGAGDVEYFCNPPCLCMSGETICGGEVRHTFIPIMKLTELISVICWPVP